MFSTENLDKLLKYSRVFWRVVLMYLLILILFINFVAAPLFGFHYNIPSEMWDVILLCFSIFLGGRSLEKIAPVIASLKTKKATPDVDVADNLSEEDNASI